MTHDMREIVSYLKACIRYQYDIFAHVHTDLTATVNFKSIVQAAFC